MVVVGWLVGELVLVERARLKESCLRHLWRCMWLECLLSRGWDDVEKSTGLFFFFLFGANMNLTASAFSASSLVWFEKGRRLALVGLHMLHQKHFVPS